MDVFDILDRLVAFPSVAGKPNGGIAGWIKTHLAEHSTQVTVLPGPEGDRSNLFATIGPADVPGYILSGHMDVVPASEPQWSSAPFALRARRRTALRTWHHGHEGISGCSARGRAYAGRTAPCQANPPRLLL